ncbi:MAG: inositol monophosphatase family protein, partial [Pontibacterium sp.]
MQPMVTIALRAARAASEHIVRATERLDLIKSEKQDVARFVADTCQQVEKTIVHTLQKAYPSHTVIGEYTGTHEPAETGPQFTWHVTPIDSITNFISGLPQVAISIAGFQNK